MVIGLLTLMRRLGMLPGTLQGTRCSGKCSVLQPPRGIQLGLSTPLGSSCVSHVQEVLQDRNLWRVALRHMLASKTVLNLGKGCPQRIHLWQVAPCICSQLSAAVT